MPLFTAMRTVITGRVTTLALAGTLGVGAVAYVAAAEIRVPPPPPAPNLPPWTPTPPTSST